MTLDAAIETDFWGSAVPAWIGAVSALVGGLTGVGALIVAWLSYRKAGEAKQGAVAAIERDNQTREIVKDSIQLEAEHAVTFETWAKRNFPDLLVRDIDDPWLGADEDTQARFRPRQGLIAKLDEPFIVPDSWKHQFVRPAPKADDESSSP